MLKRIIAAFGLVFTVSIPSAAHAYVLPVIDVAAIAQLIAEVALLLEQLGVMGDQLDTQRAQLGDMRKQARVGQVPWNEDTEALLDEMAEYGQEGPGMLYGGNLDQKWEELFIGSTPWANGEWLPASLDRAEQALATQRKLAHLITMRNESFADDHERIAALQKTLAQATGRNQLIKAAGAIQAEALRQQQMGQQMDMTIANMQAVQNGYEVNEKMANAAQEIYFLTNGGKEPTHPVFVDRGL